MKLLVLALALGAAAAPSGEAAEISPKALVLKPKAAMIVPTPHRHAPFVLPGFEPIPELFEQPDERLEATYFSCSGETSLCYDPIAGRIVFKPARALMPDLPGLQRENISVKRDRIVFRYSF